MNNNEIGHYNILTGLYLCLATLCLVFAVKDDVLFTALFLVCSGVILLYTNRRMNIEIKGMNDGNSRSGPRNTKNKTK